MAWLGFLGAIFWLIELFPPILHTMQTKHIRNISNKNGAIMINELTFAWFSIQSSGGGGKSITFNY